MGPFSLSATTNDSSDTDRGLMFVCYQTSIDNQFEFLQRTWSNTEDKPNLGGADFIIGQSDRPRRARDVSLRHTNGASATLTFRTDFVTPSGGGYFFAPGIDTLRHVISR